MKYLVLIADIEEFKPFKESLKENINKEFKIAHMPAFDFSIKGVNATAVCFGIGKVNAAMGATLALSFDKFDGVINTGWSGAVSGVLKGDIIVSDSCTECDFDLTPIGRLPGQKPGQDEYIYNCKGTKLYNAATAVEGFKHGNLGTGDFFLTDNARKEKYKEIFNIISFDMESGALGAVCYLLGVPFVSIRKISDSADDVSVDDYKASLTTDTTAFSDIIIKVLENLA